MLKLMSSETCSGAHAYLLCAQIHLPEFFLTLSRMQVSHLGVEDGGVLGGDVSAGDVGAEQGQGHKRGGADGIALADGGGGVAGRVQRICALADVLAHASHLCNASGVVADGAICVDGQACTAANVHLRHAVHETHHPHA